MTDTEVLLAAADLIERNGLHKGDYWPGWPESYTAGKSCCALGAILVVTGKDVSARHESANHLANVVGQVDDWSDSHSQAQVVATLRAVATSEET